MQRIKLSTPQPVAFTCVSGSNLQTRLDPATANAGGAMSFTVRVIKADGTSVAGGGSGGIGGGSGGVTQPDVTNAKGSCFYTPGATDLNVIGPAIIRIADANALMEPREILVDVTPGDPYLALKEAAVAAGTLTATLFTTNLTETVADHWKDAFCRFLTGSLAGQEKKITSYNGLTKALGFTSGFTAAPSAADTFEIVNG